VSFFQRLRHDDAMCDRYASRLGGRKPQDPSPRSADGIERYFLSTRVSVRRFVLWVRYAFFRYSRLHRQLHESIVEHFVLFGSNSMRLDRLVLFNPKFSRFIKLEY
jgi:hypothetical protein